MFSASRNANPCDVGNFWCGGGGDDDDSRCLKISNVCDGVVQCKDASDEQ